ncbi:MAG: bifunctional UDP-sugar hydrolase/5'-nucleotidase [Thermoanaerobaculia bacterium]
MRRLAIAFLLVAGAHFASGVTLTILHTSDLHGRVHPHDALADRDLGEGLARVAAAVKAIRAEGNAVLLLDSGDTIQGAPEQTLALEGRAGDGSDPIVRAMNLVGYDAMAIGNHEFDFGKRRLEESRKAAKFAWLSANTLGPSGDPPFPPYVVREIAGLRVGILGLVTNQVGNWISPALLEKLRFTEPVAIARRWVPVLREQERCDLVVVITHQGFERDPATGKDSGGAGENRAYALATQVPGIDLLLTGHAHTIVNPQRLGGAWVSQPGRWGNTLTRYDLSLVKNGEAWKLADVRGRNLPMKRILPDPEIVASVAVEHGAAMRVLAEKVADLASPVSARRVRFEDSALLDWLHAVQLREGAAELSFCTLLPVQFTDWPAGPLTVRQIWQFYPYENSLVTLKATGREVRAALERSAECIADPTERLRSCDTLEGAEYTIDPRRQRGQRVVSLSRGGRAIADTDTFTVALNSYRAGGGGGYGMWKRAERLRETGRLRDLLIADARAKKRLELQASGNWRTVAAP